MVEVSLDLVMWIVFVSGKGNSRSSCVDRVRSGRGEFRIMVHLELTL